MKVQSYHHLEEHYNFISSKLFHQLRIWVTADKAQIDERDPNFYCWTLEKNKFVPRTADVRIAPTDLIVSYDHATVNIFV